MNLSGKIITVTLFVLVIVVIINLYYGLFDTYTFMGSLYIAFLFLFLQIYLIVSFHFRSVSEQNEINNKNKLDYVFMKVNEILSRMPDFYPIKWDEGRNIRSEPTLRTNGIVTKNYRSIEGVMKNEVYVIVIYCFEDEDIVRYCPNPSPQIIRNHFHDFNPLGRQENNNNYYNYQQRKRYNVGGYNPHFNDIPFSSNQRNSFSLDNNDNKQIDTSVYARGVQDVLREEND